MEQGFFITFEGLDGSGKTTQLRLLAAALADRGYQVVTTRQPGGTVLGDRIRDVLLDSRTDQAVGGIAPEAEMALMFADRAQSLAQVILPALHQGAIVLCDRYTDSSEAYQGAGRQLGPDRIREMHNTVCHGFQPQLTVLLLPPLEASLERARRRNQRHVRALGKDENRFERENDEFYSRVHAQYEAIARRDARRVLVIEGEQAIPVIASRIIETVLDRLPAAAVQLSSGPAQPV